VRLFVVMAVITGARRILWVGTHASVDWHHCWGGISPPVVLLPGSAGNKVHQFAAFRIARGSTKPSRRSAGGYTGLEMERGKGKPISEAKLLIFLLLPRSLFFFSHQQQRRERGRGVPETPRVIFSWLFSPEAKMSKYLCNFTTLRETAGELPLRQLPTLHYAATARKCAKNL